MTTVRVRGLLFVVLAAALPAHASGGAFPIATTQQPEHTSAAAFDGTNFLVGVQGTGVVGAQLVSPSGAVLGSAFVPRPGDPARIAFDGTNYLLVWADRGAVVTVHGQLVSTQGSLVGQPFLVSQSQTVTEVSGVAFDGTNYLVVWEDDLSGKDIYGRFVSTAGGPVGPDFEISEGGGKEATLAFGEDRYLVIWQEELANTAHARFLSPAGARVSGVFTVHESGTEGDSDASGVAFDGTNFLVVWSHEVGGPPAWDLVGQFVSPTAALVGSPIPITTAPGPQVIPHVTFDGVHYLITWTDARNDANGDFVCDTGEGTCIDVYGQFLSPSRSLVGANFAVTSDPDNEGQSPVAYGGGKYLVAWTSRFETPSADVFGIFLPREIIFGDGFQ